MAELAHAYVSLRISTQNMAKDTRKALQGLEPEAAKTGQKMGGKISSGIGSALKKSAIGVGVAGGAALAAGLHKGIGRLNSIEQATAKLSGLGNSAADVGNILDDALSSVRGTSYGLEEAATIAASAVAAGIKPGQDLERTLKLTGDAAAIAGTDLQSMGSIINKVATSDMMQMDVANQLMDAGIPILQMVGQELGVTAEEARKMASAGEISFEIFQNALEQGVGGAALKMGDTTEGAFKNMGAAAGRLGATLAGPFFDQAGGAFRGITELLDELNATAGPAMEQVADWLKTAGASAKDAFAQFRQSEFAREAMSDLSGIFRSLSGVAADVWPSLVKIGDALAEASAALGVSAWSAFVAALEVGAGVLGALTGPLETVADIMKAQPGLVTAAVAAWMLFKTVPATVGKVGSALEAVNKKFDPLRSGFANFGKDIQEQQRYAAYFGESIGRTEAAMGAMGARAQGAMGKVKTSVKGAVDALGGLTGIALTGAVMMLSMNASSAQSAKAANEALAEAAGKGAEAQRELSSALGETNNALDGQALSAAVDMVNSSMAETLELGKRGHTSMENLGHLIDNLTGNMFGLNDAWEADYDRVTANIENYDALQSVMADSGLTMKGVQEAVAQGGPVYEQLLSDLRNAGEGGQRMADVFSESRDRIAGMQAAVENVGPGFMQLRDALDVLGDASATADQKLSSMRTTLEILGYLKTTAAERTAEVAKAVDNLGTTLSGTTVAADEFGRSFQNADGSLNTLNSNTHSLQDAMSGITDKMMSVASAGGDVQGAFESIQPELNAAREQAEAMGLDWDGLLESFALTPESIQTMVSVSGLEEAEQDIVAVTAKLREAEVGTRIPVILDGGDESVRQLELLGIKVDEFDLKTGSAYVSVDNEVALGRISNTNSLLNGLDQKTSISDILAVNGDAQGKIWETQGGLNTLDSTNPLSTIMAENGQAQGAIGESQGGLDHLGDTHPESKITADNRQADSAIRDVNTWLANIPQTKAVRVVFKAIYEGFRNLTGGSDNASGGAWDGARALPAFARGGHNGYRLPKSGPGTEVTDGFIAFNSDNVPAARLDAGEWIINRRSSDKYNRELAAINAGVFPKLPGYADGGRADAKDLLDFVHNRSNHGQSRSLEGAPYVFGGINWGDCSSAMAAIARFAVGLAPFADRFATANQRTALLGLGFKLGRGGSGDLRIGWMNGGPGGGHTSGTLPDGTNVEMGGARGNGQIGGGAAPASHPQYTDHAYLPIHTWQFAGVEGLEGLMPPGASTTWSGMSGISGGTTTPGLYASPGNSGQVAENQPRTWSDMAAGATAALVGGQVEDALGIFGVPNQLPPIVQAWQMLNEKPGGGPSDWDLSTAAAEVKRLDAAIKIRERITSEAAKVLDTMRNSPAGDPLQSQMQAAESELDKAILDLERDRMAQEDAQARLKDLVGARAAAMATKDSPSSASELASTALGGAPDVGFPDELMREMKLAYDPAKGAEQWRPMVIAALKRNGFAATQREQDLMIAQINTESGGDPNILQQIQDVNSGGNEAQGLLQIIPGTFAAHRDPSLPDDRRDPWANMNAALRYYKGRYGMDLGQMWGKGHGYSTGGWISGFGSKDSVPLVGAPGEFIVNRKAAAQNRDMLEAMNSGQPVAPAAGGVTYNIYAFDLDEAMARTQRREAQHAQTYMGAR